MEEDLGQLRASYKVFLAKKEGLDGVVKMSETISKVQEELEIWINKMSRKMQALLDADIFHIK